MIEYNDLSHNDVYDIFAAGVAIGQGNDIEPPARAAVAALLIYVRTRWLAAHPQCIIPPAGPVPDWLLAEMGDDPQLLADERVDWLLNLPRSETYPQPDLWFLGKTPTPAD